MLLPSLPKDIARIPVESAAAGVREAAGEQTVTFSEQFLTDKEKADKEREDKERERLQIEALIRSQAAHFTVTDEAIADQIKRRVYASGDGLFFFSSICFDLTFK